MTATAELPTTLRKAFAVAVAKPGMPAVLFDAENRRTGCADLESAVAGGRPFTVQLREEIFAVDHDAPQRQEHVDALLAELRGEGALPVVLASGRPGHAHLFARIHDRAPRERYAAMAKLRGLEVRRAIRPPGAPHRHGLPVTFMEPADPWTALERLSPPAPAPLSTRMLKLLGTGDIAAAGYRDRSAALFGFTLAAVDAGWSCDQFTEALLVPSNRLGEKLWDRSPAARRRYLEATWAKAEARAERFPAISSRAEVLTIIDGIRETASAHRWKGMAGLSDRDVLLAHLELAAQVGSLRYHGSVRTIAELAAQQRTSVTTAQARLRASGWIDLVQAARGTNANVWRLRAGTRTDTPTSRARSEAGTTPDTPTSLRGVMRKSVRGSTAAPTHDVWRWRGVNGARGLGKAAHRVWFELSSGARPSSELCERLGLKERMLRRHLARLATYGLAEREGTGWKRGAAELDAVAEILGVAGTAERQRRQHSVERATYALRDKA